jgi:predicted TIM-barrel fold metal-dependent hydrolase
MWANSGDSHVLEPAGLFEARMRPDLAARMPHAEKDPDGKWETVHIDGRSFRRRIPARPLRDEETGQTAEERAPGAHDAQRRLKDLDSEGIWAELIYPSISIWNASLTDPELLREGVRVLNDWTLEFQQTSARYVCTAHLPLLDVDDAVREIDRVAALGFHAVFVPVAPPPAQPAFNHDAWEPVWTAIERNELVMGVHIGTEPHEADVINGQYHRGPGGAILNYFETSFGGQRMTAQLIASGVFDRHPGLRVVVSEGGAGWVPFLGDRMDEGYSQHSSAVRPRLQRRPSEYLFDHVYASFQHDANALATATAMGWRNVLWGSDYPHVEGTFGHTQRTLHGLFDTAAPDVRERVLIGAFQELFPHVPPAPAPILELVP